jgi:hypothetical protein
MNKTRQAAEQLGWARRMDAIGLGMGQFGNQATSTGLALTAGNQALSSGQVPLANLSAASQSANQSYGGAMQGWSSVGTLGVQKYNADVNAWGQEQQARAAAIGAIAQGGGTAAGIAYAKSDVRVKRDIRRVGTLDNGLPVYVFRYIGEEGFHMGVMAQEVEKVMPHAVVEVGGVKHVYYGAI